MYFFLKGNAYLIGGNENGRNVAIVDKMNLFDGRITQVSPLIHPRSQAAVVVSDKCIRVFGGSFGAQSLRSCEEYNIDTNE